MKVAAVILFALIVAFVIGRKGASSDAPQVAAAQPAGVVVVQIVSSVCDPNYGRPKAEYVVKNAGPAVSWLRGYVRVGSTIHSAYFTPENLPTDALATLKVYGEKGDAATCSLESIQDGNGQAGMIR